MSKSIYDMKPDQITQTPDQLERVSLLDERSKDGAHSDEDLKSYVQLAYYAGHQWIALSKASKQIVPLPKEDWQVHYTANRIMPIIRKELAKITRNKLSKAVVPASTEDEDIRAARLAEKVVEWLEYELKLQEVDEESILWALVTRIGFVMPFWNPNKGAVIATDNGKPIYEGDVDIESMSLFEVKWDRQAKKWREVRWVLREKVRPVSYIKAVYNKDVPPEEGLSASNIYDGKLRNLSSGSELFSTQSDIVKDCATVRECWEAPSYEYPKGRRITAANGIELLYEEDIGFGEEDHTTREIPIFSLIHIPVPGKIIGSSVNEQCIPVQKEYNRSRSQIIENKDLMANPKWLAESGSVVGDEIDSAPGTVVWYRKGFNAPVMTQPTALGSDAHKNIEACLEEFMYISSQQEVSHGSVPTGVNSGVAIQLLQEQDDTTLAPTTAKYGRYKQAYLSYALKIVKFKYDTTRTIKIVGRNKRIEAIDLKGSDLTSTDVRFEDMSLTQLTRTAKKQYILELVNMQVLNPAQDRDLIIRMLELGITDELYDGLEVDVQQAMNENGEWSKGVFTAIVREFYNHEVHVAQHNKFRKGDEYESLSPEEKQVIDEHVQQHMDYVMQAMMPQQTPGAQDPNAESSQLDMGRVVGALSPEEQATLKQNPHLLDSLSGSQA